MRQPSEKDGESRRPVAAVAGAAGGGTVSAGVERDGRGRQGGRGQRDGDGQGGRSNRPKGRDGRRGGGRDGRDGGRGGRDSRGPRREKDWSGPDPRAGKAEEIDTTNPFFQFFQKNQLSEDAVKEEAGKKKEKA